MSSSVKYQKNISTHHSPSSASSLPTPAITPAISIPKSAGENGLAPLALPNPLSPQSKDSHLDLKINYSPHLTNHYHIRNVLGEGVSGAVVAASCKKTGNYVAIKLLRKAGLSITHWKRDRELNTTIPMEIFILKRLSHPGIVSFVRCIEDPDYFYLVMELVGSPSPHSIDDSTSMDLFQFIKESPSPIPENIIARIFSQLVDAVAYLHQSGYVHRDIKDENIIISSSHVVKLVDFGAAEKIPVLSKDFFSSFRGSPRYSPPEIYASSHHQGPQVDVWCLGIVLFTLMYNTQPFATRRDIINFDLPLLPWDRSECLQNLLMMMLQSDPQVRATIEMIKDHPFLSSR